MPPLLEKRRGIYSWVHLAKEFEKDPLVVRPGFVRKQSSVWINIK